MTGTFHLAVLVAIAGSAAGAWAQSTFQEIEPNETKAQATPVPGMVAGDSIVGNTIGNTSSAGADSCDTFRVRTGPLPLGIYRHRLTLSTLGTAGHAGTIRGLSQTAGAITPDTDVAVQSSSSTTSPARMNQWYGFGRQEEVFYRVSGSASTTANYAATLDTTPVAPVDVLYTFPPGSLTITTVGQTGVSQTDTDLWVYDANLSAMPGFGNDDEPSAATRGSTLTRTFPSGIYYLAIGNYNTCNDQPSPGDDGYGQGSVLDFPNAAVNSSTTTGVNVSFRITDSQGRSVFKSAMRNGSYDILWYTLYVGIAAPCYPNCDNSTAQPALNANDFQCFINAFAANSAYANCDGSTTPPILTANDFQCFINAFAAGCN